jgi:hypothetical protein
MKIAAHSQSDHQFIPSNQGAGKVIPAWIVWTQCVCFAVLFAIWYYPRTNFLSDLCMIIGALLSVYVLFVNRSFFKTKQSIPFWLLVLLLIWLVFHLLFLSNNLPLQFREFTSIWKRAVIGIVFALGFGMALASTKTKNGIWVLFYLGVIMPTLIFLTKYLIRMFASRYGWDVPEYLALYAGRYSAFYIYKTDYVLFCLPALAISLAQLKDNLNKDLVLVTENLAYLLMVAAVLTTFFLGGIKNGMAYSALLILVFIICVLRTQFNKTLPSGLGGKLGSTWFLKLSMLFMMCAVCILAFVRHIDQNPSWKSLWADSKVAMKVDQIDSWKYWGAKGYPLNEYGNHVSATNYERLAWGIVGLRLLGENPLGYGLIENSFYYLTKKNWPDSLLSQSHSGWLDLALGIGIPGFGLLLIAFLLAMFFLIFCKANNHPSNQREFWSRNIVWVMSAIILLWCTSEISFKIPLINLLFWVALATGVSYPIRVAQPH